MTAESERAIAQAIERLATQVKYLGTGDNGDPRGAIEFFTTTTSVSASDLAEAIREHGRSIENAADILAASIRCLVVGNESGTFHSPGEIIGTAIQKGLETLGGNIFNAISTFDDSIYEKLEGVCEDIDEGVKAMNAGSADILYKKTQNALFAFCNRQSVSKIYESNMEYFPIPNEG